MSFMMHFEKLEKAGLRCAAISDLSDGDCRDTTETQRNVYRFLTALTINPTALVRLRQVHGTHIVDANEALIHKRAGSRIEADGVYTSRPGIALGITVADCAPVILYDPERRVTAAIHAGREGILNTIAAKGVHALRQTYGCCPDSLVAVVGPCAGVCCYEVSIEIVDQWKRIGLPCIGRKLDLAAALRWQLETAGVFRHNIEIVPHCTVCGGVFFSYRAGGQSSRNLVVVML